MKMKNVLLATTALAIYAAAGQAQAGGMYVGMFGGANWMADSSASIATGGGGSTNYSWEMEADTGFVLGGNVGYHLDSLVKGFSFEVEAAYRRNDVPGVWDFDLGAETGTIEANQSTFSVMANLWYELSLGKVRPYIGGGGGWAHAMLDGAVIAANGTTIDDSFDLSDGDFAWQAGGGINYEAAPGVEVGIGYRYFKGNDFPLAFTIDPIAGAAETFGAVDNENHAAVFSLSVDID
jgi:opacity protein-like surface antigen